jgi:eukaryotic-like serine/threonine-protein kinase
MADVYRALDRVLNREVAVKVLREGTAEESDRARFIDEARTLAGLSHSGLVTVLDAGFGPEAWAAVPPGLRPVAVFDHPYLVMELVDGPTLAQAIAEARSRTRRSAPSASRSPRRLAYVHAHDVVHRDVKPGNVLLSSEHRAKLADFGIARLLADTARHTRTGRAMGTAAYLAPEQITGQPVSGSTDVYSLGLVLLEALTGQLEYPGPGTEAALARLHSPPRIPGRQPARPTSPATPRPSCANRCSGCTTPSTESPDDRRSAPVPSAA